jgi:hypothetical protein
MFKPAPPEYRPRDPTTYSWYYPSAPTPAVYSPTNSEVPAMWNGIPCATDFSPPPSNYWASNAAQVPSVPSHTNSPVRAEWTGLPRATWHSPAPSSAYHQPVVPDRQAANNITYHRDSQGNEWEHHSSDNAWRIVNAMTAKNYLMAYQEEQQPQNSNPWYGPQTYAVQGYHGNRES